MGTGLVEAVRSFGDVDVAALDRDALLPRLREIHAARRLLDGAEAAVLARVDRDEVYADVYARNTQHLLSDQLRVPNGDAARRVLAARAVQQLPETAAALAAGQVGFEEVAVLARVMNPAVYDTLLADEAVMLGWAQTMPHRDFVRKVNEWAADTDPACCDAASRPSSLSLTRGIRGRGVLAGDLDPQDHLTLHAMLHGEVERIFRQEHADRDQGLPVAERPHGERLAEAWMNVVQRAATGGDDTIATAPRAEIGIVVTEDQLRAHTGGHSLDLDSPIPAEVLAEISCGASHYRAVMNAPGEVLDLGRTVRSATPAQKRAVAVRDRHCVTPGCDRPPRMCHVHHVVWFRNGGHTDIDQLVLLCPRHHRQLHAGTFSIRRNPPGSSVPFRFENAHGEELRARERDPEERHTPAPEDHHGSVRGAPLPEQLLLPYRRQPSRGVGRGSRPARSGRPRDHRS